MRIGLSSIVGDGFGTGSFQISEIAGEISFPAQGTILETLTGQTYPIAEGGAAVTVNSNNYPSQTASVYRKANGSGGNYLEWASAFDIAYIGNGTTFESSPNQAYQGEVPSSSGNYYQGGTYTILYKHDGAGGYYEDNTNYSYYGNGTDTNISGLGSNQQTEIPSGSGNYFDNGQMTGYTWNGSGGYNYPVTKGSYYNSGVFITFVPDGTFSTSTEVPSGSGNYYDAKQCGNDYFWNGSGGTNGAVAVCKYYPNGTYIYNDGTSSYYWDGSGGYYT